MKDLPSDVKKFLSNNNVATIATISPDNDFPYVIPVYYVTIDGNQLYFACHKESKTLRNIMSHPHVSISITNSSNLTQLQLHGTTMVAGQKVEIIKKILTVAEKKSRNLMPPIMQINSGIMKLVTFIIYWYKLSNYSGQEPVFNEGTLENKPPIS